MSIITMADQMAQIESVMLGWIDGSYGDEEALQSIAEILDLDTGDDDQ